MNQRVNKLPKGKRIEEEKGERRIMQSSKSNSSVWYGGREKEKGNKRIMIKKLVRGARALLLTGFLLLTIIFAFNVTFIPSVKGDPSWLTGWQYRKSHVLNGATGAGTDYQVRLNVHYGAFVLGAWTIKSPIPIGVSDMAIAVYNDKIYVIGGYGVSPSDYRTDVQVYDPSSNSWTSKTPMPTARWMPMGVCANNKIYVFGGQTSAGITNKLEVYDPNSDTWDTSKTPMPYSLGGAGCVYDSDNGLIYIIEGKTFSYYPSGDTYDTSLADCPQTVQFGTCAYKDGKIYLIGGWSGSTTQVNRVYTISSNSWSAKADAPERRLGQSGYTGPSIMGDYIFYTHGCIDFSTFTRTNFRYQISTDSWVQLADAFYDRDGCGSAVVNGKLYVIGGRPGATYGLTYNEEFDPNAVVGDNGENVGLNGHCRADFGDVRFTGGDGTTLLDYWIESKFDGDHAIFWVKIQDNLGSAQTIYIYYGKSDATTTSNGDNTFLFFDDFTTSIDWTNKWQSTGQTKYSVESGKLKFLTPDPMISSKLLNSKNAFNGFAAECLIRQSVASCESYFDFEPNVASYTLGTSGDQAIFYLDSSQLRAYVGGSGAIVSETPDINAYYKVVYLCPSSGNAVLTIYKNEAQKVQMSATPSQRTVHVSFLSWMPGGIGYADDVFVHKYVSPGPSHGSWGTEQIWIQVNSQHDSPTASQWVYQDGSLPVSVTSPAEVVSGDHQWVCTGYSIDGGASTPGTSYPFTNVQTAHTIDFNWKEQFWITVTSAHDSPTASAWVDDGGAFTASVTSPADIVPNDHRWVCTGYSIDGGTLVPGTTYTFPNVLAKHTIVFNWKEQFYLTVTSPYDTPTGQGWYDANTPVTSSVDLMVHVGSNFYKCYGWTGTGSAPASGTGNTVSFTITQASSVTWKWGSSVGGEWFPATTLPTVAPSNVLQLLAPWIVLAFVAASVFAAYQKLFKKRW